MRGPSASRTTFGSLEQRRALVLGEAALRSDQHRERRPDPCAARAAVSAATGSLRLGVLVAEHQQARRVAGRRACGRAARARQSPGSVRMPHCSAASIAFARMRSRLTRADLGVAGQHRLQPRGAHLDRLLHHVVEPGVLERGEQVVQIERLRSAPARAPRPCSDSARLPLSASVARHSPSRPLNTSTPIAGLEAQHVDAGSWPGRGRAATSPPPASGRVDKEPRACGNRSAAW